MTKFTTRDPWDPPGGPWGSKGGLWGVPREKYMKFGQNSAFVDRKSDYI